MTAVVATANVADEFPPGTLMLDWTCAAPMLLAKLTNMPPTGAGPESFTSPVVEAPPPTAFGSSSTATSAGGTTVRMALLVTFPTVAVIVTAVGVATATVLTENDAIASPPLALTFGSTIAAGLLHAKLISNPAEGAGPLSLIVACAELPPVTVCGETSKVTATGTEARTRSFDRWSSARLANANVRPAFAEVLNAKQSVKMTRMPPVDLEPAVRNPSVEGTDFRFLQNISFNCRAPDPMKADQILIGCNLHQENPVIHTGKVLPCFHSSNWIGKDSETANPTDFAR